MEVDFVLPRPDAGLAFVEAKWTRTPRPDDAKGIRSLMPRAKAAPVEEFLRLV